MSEKTIEPGDLFEDENGARWMCFKIKASESVKEWKAWECYGVWVPREKAGEWVIRHIPQKYVLLNEKSQAEITRELADLRDPKKWTLLAQPDPEERTRLLDAQTKAIRRKDIEAQIRYKEYLIQEEERRIEKTKNQIESHIQLIEAAEFRLVELDEEIATLNRQLHQLIE